MNKNQENYKKAIDQIHVDPNLKDKVLEDIKAKEKMKKTIYYLRYAVGIAAVAVVAVVGVSFLNKPNHDTLDVNKNLEITKEEKDKSLASVDIRRFESMEELRDVLKESEKFTRNYYNDFETFDVVAEGESITKASQGVVDTNSVFEDVEQSDYSRTNNQVENVDEADIVKTDGKYIYYSEYNQVYIIDKDLNLISTIKEDSFLPYQIFVNSDKLVVFGNDYQNSREKTEAKIYNIENREEPELIRTISVDGYYQDARMIENNVYFVSSYNIYFYRELEDYEILPSYRDTMKSDEDKVIEATDIAYFENTNSYGYSIIAGFSLDDEEEVNIETFFGAGNEMYVSENNMYIVAPQYKDYWYAENSIIYKFHLENSTIVATASGTVKGYVNNQFSIDEYDGNLRIATTSYKNSYRGDWNYDPKYSTHLTIFDENLETIGAIDNLIKDEEIYAVRFIGEIGYIVTFQEIDPLWVIDLSDPTNPVIKGELEIPGYSSYLHPYDETHIIGIGYNVVSNGYGGVMNDMIKMSMFDVSDLENPKEIFNVTVGNEYSYSNIMDDHKALFFNKEEDLIGFPIRSWYNTENRSGIALYKIDLENNQFEEISNLTEKGYNYAERALYIGKNIYVLYEDKITKYDMITFEEVANIEIDNDDRYYYW